MSFKLHHRSKAEVKYNALSNKSLWMYYDLTKEAHAGVSFLYTKFILNIDIQNVFFLFLMAALIQDHCTTKRKYKK